MTENKDNGNDRKFSLLFYHCKHFFFEFLRPKTDNCELKNIHLPIIFSHKCMRLLQSILSIAMTGNKDNGNDRKESPLTLSLRGEREIFGYLPWGEGNSQISFEGKGEVQKKDNFLMYN